MNDIIILVKRDKLTPYGGILQRIKAGEENHPPPERLFYVQEMGQDKIVWSWSGLAGINHRFTGLKENFSRDRGVE